MYIQMSLSLRKEWVVFTYLYVQRKFPLNYRITATYTKQRSRLLEQHSDGYRTTRYSMLMSVFVKLSNVCSISRVVNERRTSLNNMTRHSYLELIGVRGHSNSSGNLAIDALTKRVARLNIEETISWFVMQTLIVMVQNRWECESSCSISRTL